MDLGERIHGAYLPGKPLERELPRAEVAADQERRAPGRARFPEDSAGLLVEAHARCVPRPRVGREEVPQGPRERAVRLPRRRNRTHGARLGPDAAEPPIDRAGPPGMAQDAKVRDRHREGGARPARQMPRWASDTLAVAGAGPCAMTHPGRTR